MRINVSNRFYGSPSRGFTIVELLVVISVIGILAAIIIVAFNGIQARARDAQRIQDITSIVKSLEMYKHQTGIYPDEVQTAGSGGWEVTTDGVSATDFLSALRSSAGGMSKVPVDPKNVAVGSRDPNSGANNYVYFYHRYPAGSGGCPLARGDFYVLGVQRMETLPAGGIHSSSPGFACTTNWGNFGGGIAWITGGFTNN